MPILYNTGDWFTLQPGITYRFVRSYPFNANSKSNCISILLHPYHSYKYIRPLHRKYELYNMEWSPENELNQMSLIAAPFGGPISVVRDVKQLVKVAGATSKPVIRIFTTSGHLISTINVNWISHT